MCESPIGFFFFLHMEHQFNTEIAAKYGIEEAILIHNLFFWIQKNAVNGRHFYDGSYWTYNSASAFSDLFPYMSPKKIHRLLSRLVDIGILIKGNYNDVKFDRTTWYSFTDIAIEELSSLGYKMPNDNKKYHVTNEKIELPKNETPFPKNVQPIPDSKPDIKESTNVDEKETDVSSLHPDFIKFNEWIKRKAPFCSNIKNFSSQITEDEFFKLKESYTGKQIGDTIEQIENRKDLRKRYSNLYRTVLNWLKKEYGDNKQKQNTAGRGSEVPKALQ